MTTTERIKVTKAEVKDIVKAAYPDYRGRKFFVQFANTVTLYDLNWGGGSRNEYTAISADGKVAHPHIPAPWAHPYEGAQVNVPTDAVIVKHAVFCGHDCGITIYVNPANAPKWLKGA